jgi:ribose 5-phosphate isomerase A
VDCHTDDEIRVDRGRDNILHGRFRIERDSGAETEAAGERNRPTRIVARLDVEGDAVPAGTRNHLEVALRLRDHEVAVEETAPRMDEGRKRGEHYGPDRDLGDEAAVTHVELEDPRARGGESGDLVTEAREVGRIQRRHNLDLADFAPRHAIEANGTATGAVELPADVADLEREKQLAAEAAAALAERGMSIGLGTGSTATYFVQALAARGLDLVCVATSPATEALAVELGLNVVPFEGKSAPRRLDLAVDGADQLAADGWLVKGNGGAHTRERIVAASADRFVVVMSSDKLVEGIRPPIPLELLAFGVEATLARIGPAELRDAPATPDSGVLADWLGPVDDPAELAACLSETPGVVDHGLFSPDLVSEVLVGRGDQVDRLPGRRI